MITVLKTRLNYKNSFNYYVNLFGKFDQYG